MCGISGYYSFDGAIDPAQAAAARRVNARLAHRGPDDSGFFADSRALLGHRRLSILDLSADGHQPMSNEDGTVWIAFNGEIYNFLELRHVLLAAGHRFRSRTDTEVLLHGYEEWGIAKLLEKLNGMFAFALYDSAAPRLVLARDRFGIKPLYYAEGPDARSVVFASETRALVESGLASSELDRRALAGFLLFGSIPAPLTIRRGVRCLPAGHYMVLGREGVGEPRRYWDFAQATAGERQHASAAPSIAATLEEAVASHLISDAPLGVFLSGGMDSAAIAAIASRHAGPLKTLTVTFGEGAYNEAVEARAAADAFGAEHHELRVTSADFLAEMPSFLASMDQPTNDGVNTYFVSKAARQIGLKVVLSGLGGDEVFWGYRHYSWLEGRMPWLKMLLALPAPVRRTVQAASAVYGRATGQERWRRLAGLNSRPSAGALYFMARGFFSTLQASRLLGVSVAELNNLMEESLESADHLDGAEFNRLEVRRYLHDQLLRDADVFSMAHSIETRIPFLDPQLACRAACLPALAKRSNGVNKPALLAAMPHPMVAAAARRKKMGFTFPIGQWLESNLGPMREMAGRSTALDAGEAGRLFRAFGAGRLHWSRAWAMVVLGAAVRQ
ncbi:MAG TPA: asparagine synthase (glutamine-hydrolyzing) [Bryobacteraceae bacterium]|jgi:asparagine synthase (glutamine-hydrolysing)|nr:asparagine synthase (glutamine-hydrolyzing) [Bryobacteraceae bacterium]